MTATPPGPGAPAVEATAPTDEQIMGILNLTVTSTEQLCNRLRDLFAGVDFANRDHDWLRSFKQWAEGPDDAVLDFRQASVPGKVQDLLDAAHARRPATLEEIQEEVYEINVANGWYEDERAFGDDIALLHSEVSEMYEAYRDHLLEDATVYETYVGRDALTKTDPVPVKNPKPEGVGSEAADVLIRLLDTCRRAGLDLRWEVERKLAFNRTRGYRHGGKHV